MILFGCLLTVLFASIFHEKNIFKLLDEGNLDQAKDLLSNVAPEEVPHLMIYLAEKRKFEAVKFIFFSKNRSAIGLAALFHHNSDLAHDFIASTQIDMDHELVSRILESQPLLLENAPFIQKLFKISEDRNIIVSFIIKLFFSKHGKTRNIYTYIERISGSCLKLREIAIHMASVHDNEYSDEKLLAFVYNPRLDAYAFSRNLENFAGKGTSVEAFVKFVRFAERDDFLALREGIKFNHVDKERAFNDRFDEVIGYMSPPGTLFPTRFNRYKEFEKLIKQTLSTKESFPDALINIIMKYHCIEPHSA